jgi:hypothetical protein
MEVWRNYNYKSPVNRIRRIAMNNLMKLKTFKAIK